MRHPSIASAVHVRPDYALRVRRMLDGGIEIDDDPARVDALAVHAFLAGDEAYWVEERSLEMVQATIANASRVIGAYDGDALVGFARAVSDGLTVACLDDVFVVAGCRGRGIGLELVRELVERPPLAGLNWLLFTSDAHDFYARVGFAAPPDYVLMREGTAEEPPPEH